MRVCEIFCADKSSRAVVQCSDLDLTAFEAASFATLRREKRAEWRAHALGFTDSHRYDRLVRARGEGSRVK